MRRISATTLKMENSPGQILETLLVFSASPSVNRTLFRQGGNSSLSSGCRRYASRLPRVALTIGSNRVIIKDFLKASTWRMIRLPSSRTKSHILESELQGVHRGIDHARPYLELV